jgi:enamine deaminase RidA (YjgF/YER057c/UK114 family)
MKEFGATQMTTSIHRGSRRVALLGVTWEESYGYAQAVRVNDTIYVSGQLSHDAAGNLVGAARVDDAGHVTDTSNMELQMRTTYANARVVLEQLGATLDDVVEEVIYVTDLPSAFRVAGSVRKEAYASDFPACASTIVEVKRLAFPEQLIEVKFRAVVRERLVA